MGKLYGAYGPYPFSFENGSNFREALKRFWQDVEKDKKAGGLKTAVGVYIWTWKENGKRIPWNVGLTNKGFGKRFLQKQLTFVNFQYKVGNPEMEVFILALKTPQGRFRKPSKSKTISSNDWLETMLIGSARAVNPNLRNMSKTKNLKSIVVEGYLNDDRAASGRNAAAQALRELLFVRK